MRLSDAYLMQNLLCGVDTHTSIIVKNQPHYYEENSFPQPSPLSLPPFILVRSYLVAPCVQPAPPSDSGFPPHHHPQVLYRLPFRPCGCLVSVLTRNAFYVHFMDQLSSSFSLESPVSHVGVCCLSINETSVTDVLAGQSHVRSCKDQQWKKPLEVPHDITDKQGHGESMAFLEALFQQTLPFGEGAMNLVSPCPCCSHLTTVNKHRISHKSLISFQNNMLGMEAGEVNYFFCFIQQTSNYVFFFF